MPETPCTYDTPHFDLGQDNMEVFSALGFSEEELAHMKEENVIC